MTPALSRRTTMSDLEVLDWLLVFVALIAVGVAIYGLQL